MEVVELGTNLDSVWGTFFFPFIEFIVLLIAVFFILGKNDFVNMKSQIVKYNHHYFRKRRGLYIPLSKSTSKIIDVLKAKPIVVLCVFLIGVYILDKLIGLTSTLFPIKYYYYPDELLRCAVSEDTLASLWSYTPDLSLEDLFSLITFKAKNDYTFNYSGWGKIISLFNFMIIFSVLSFIVLICKKKKKQSLRCIGVFSIAVILSLTTYLLFFDGIKTETEQKCYSVIKQYNLEALDSTNEVENKNFQKCYDALLKIKESKGDPSLFKAFGIEYDWDSIYFDMIQHCIEFLDRFVT